MLRKINTIFIFEPEQYNVKIVGENTENDV